MSNCNAYESECMSDILGQTLRPGGFQLTQKAIEFCGIKKNDRILDLGCGVGATLGYLYEKCKIKGAGLDSSEKLLNYARENFIHGEFVLGTGDNIPFENEEFDAVFSECTLSLMNSVADTLKQVNRVLKKNGFFIITDIFAGKPENTSCLDDFSINSCIKGLHNTDNLKKEIEGAGFSIEYFEDCSYLLKELMVKIIFEYGSVDVFWDKVLGCEKGDFGSGFQEKIKSCKPGYFILIARKGEDNGGISI